MVESEKTSPENKQKSFRYVRIKDIEDLSSSKGPPGMQEDLRTFNLESHLGLISFGFLKGHFILDNKECLAERE